MQLEEGEGNVHTDLVSRLRAANTPEKEVREVLSLQQEVEVGKLALKQLEMIGALAVFPPALVSPDSLNSRKTLLQKVGHAIRTYLASIMAPISEEEQRRMAEW